MLSFLASLNWTAIIITALVCDTIAGAVERLYRMVRIWRDIVRITCEAQKSEAMTQVYRGGR